MATQQQIDFVMAQLYAAYPNELIQAMNEAQTGTGAVMRILYDSEETVTAGKIADTMRISTARVAVLLKKMAAKDLIIKETDALDARVSIVRLSEKGHAAAKSTRANICAQISRVIDQVGIDRMLEFIQISRDIRSVVTGSQYEMSYKYNKDEVDRHD